MSAVKKREMESIQKVSPPPVGIRIQCEINPDGIMFEDWDEKEYEKAFVTDLIFPIDPESYTTRRRIHFDKPVKVNEAIFALERFFSQEMTLSHWQSVRPDSVLPRRKYPFFHSLFDHPEMQWIVDFIDNTIVNLEVQWFE